MQLLHWEWLLNIKHVHNWACCWLLSLKITVACPLPRRLSTSCVEVIEDTKLALHFIWKPLQKAVLEVWMAFTEMVELFCLWKRWCTLEDVYRTCNCTMPCGDVCEVEVGTVYVPIQAVTTRWHHDSGNKVQMNPKAKAILPVLEGLLQTQNTGWICEPFSELESSFLQMQAEIWAEWAQFQVTGWDLWFGVETIWTFDLQPGWSWPWLCLEDLCVFEIKSQNKVWAIGASLSQNQKGFAWPCWELL